MPASKIVKRDESAIRGYSGPEAYAPAVLEGDLSLLNAEQKILYYNAVCESVGLNPATQPFEYIKLEGKEKLYPRKECTEQLRKMYRISLSGPNISFQEGGTVMATITATMPDGRTDTDVGVVNIATCKGGQPNAIMKAITKAKRRVTLSMIGLSSYLDDDGAINPTTVSVELLQDEHGNTAAIEPAEPVLSEEQWELLSLTAKEAEWNEAGYKAYVNSIAGYGSARDIPGSKLDQMLTDLQDLDKRDRFMQRELEADMTT